MYKIGDMVYVNSTNGYTMCEIRQIPNESVVKVRYPGVEELVTIATHRLKK